MTKSTWFVDLRPSNGVKKLEPPAGMRHKDSKESDDGSSIVSAEAQLAAKQRQVMSIAYAPGGSLFTTAIMLYMSGSSIQIFSIMMTGMSLLNPLKAIFGVNQAFSKFEKEEGVDLKLPKLIYLAIQILALGMALYKCSTMGLLPITSADWTNLIPSKVYQEISAIPKF